MALPVMAPIGRFLVMRYGSRPGWASKCVSVAGRFKTLADALDYAGALRRRFETRAWIAAPGYPATRSKGKGK